MNKNEEFYRIENCASVENNKFKNKINAKITNFLNYITSVM